MFLNRPHFLVWNEAKRHLGLETRYKQAPSRAGLVLKAIPQRSSPGCMDSSRSYSTKWHWPYEQPYALSASTTFYWFSKPLALDITSWLHQFFPWEHLGWDRKAENTFGYFRVTSDSSRESSLGEAVGSRHVSLYPGWWQDHFGWTPLMQDTMAQQRKWR